MSNGGSVVEILAECEGKPAPVWCVRPRWKDVFRGYPKRKKTEKEKEYKKYGDKEYEDEEPWKVLKFLFAEKLKFTDACGARLSIALLDARINIGEYGAETMTRTIIEKGKTKTLEIGLKKITRGDIPDGIELEFPPINNLKGGNAIVRADGMQYFLWNEWGEPDYSVYQPTKTTDLQKKIGDKKGVYIMRPKYEVSTKEHPGFGASGHCTLWTGEDVIGKNHLGNLDIDGGFYAAHFWELQ